jgi:hypothetical protein
MSSMGNDQITQQYAKTYAGKDVIGTLNLNYIGITPLINAD